MLSRDPLGEGIGPNLYAYVGNDPIYWRDPLGLVACVDDAIEADAIGGFEIGVAIGGFIWATPAGQKASQAIANAIANAMAQTDKPPFKGCPGSTETKPKQTRKYGPDGYPATDVDTGHDHGAGDPHAHDWGRPADGGPPTAEDRGPGRPLQPGDPPPPPGAKP